MFPREEKTYASKKKLIGAPCTLPRICPSLADENALCPLRPRSSAFELLAQECFLNVFVAFSLRFGCVSARRARGAARRSHLGVKLARKPRQRRVGLHIVLQFPLSFWVSAVARSNVFQLHASLHWFGHVFLPQSLCRFPQARKMRFLLSVRDQLRKRKTMAANVRFRCFDVQIVTYVGATGV